MKLIHMDMNIQSLVDDPRLKNVKWNAEQLKVLELVNKGQNVFFTG